METIDLNDMVSVTLTGIGASILSEKNIRILSQYKIDYRDKDFYHATLIEIINIFSDHLKRSSLIPFYNLHKV